MTINKNSITETRFNYNDPANTGFSGTNTNGLNNNELQEAKELTTFRQQLNESETPRSQGGSGPRPNLFEEIVSAIGGSIRPDLKVSDVEDIYSSFGSASAFQNYLETEEGKETFS